MSETTTRPEGASTAVTAIASGLWLVVGSLLTYGVVQTVIKASALFTS